MLRISRDPLLYVNLLRVISGFVYFRKNLILSCVDSPVPFFIQLAESQIRIRALEDQLKVLSAGAGKTVMLAD